MNKQQVIEKIRSNRALLEEFSVFGSVVRSEARPGSDVDILVEFDPEAEKTFDAVIRQPTIMGEASSHIPEEITALSPEISWSSIRGMRNVIVHDYLSVNMHIVWKTVRKDLPDLCTRLEALQSRIANKD